MRSLALLLPVAATLSACTAPDGEYPSLLPRPIESQGMAEPDRPAPVAPPDPALDAQATAALAGIDAARSEFASAAQAAEASIAVARGLPEGSEPWLNAHKALARLGLRRSAVLDTLQDLEEVAIARGKQGLPPYPAIDAAIASLTVVATEQDARITALEAALAGR
ncbi:hypothetical protein ACFQ1E_18360 [Sphingomonas canadensis]|uniref:Uncharacterized protein n=1 Tax=Sphingomonas canadensis TaxID=1219257 RepID=A0ABW3HA57_9SPHN|nr:hypothetical protein [Sphingomonas canadensis]MCW3837895.1 hypothetical protein [Sphingomonas canadensis]